MIFERASTVLPRIPHRAAWESKPRHSFALSESRTSPLSGHIGRLASCRAPTFSSTFNPTATDQSLPPTQHQKIHTHRPWHPRRSVRRWVMWSAESCPAVIERMKSLRDPRCRLYVFFFRKVNPFTRRSCGGADRCFSSPVQQTSAERISPSPASTKNSTLKPLQLPLPSLN